jgi:hypothetical protein
VEIFKVNALQQQSVARTIQKGAHNRSTGDKDDYTIAILNSLIEISAT